jgi:hypothetical protein
MQPLIQEQNEAAKDAAREMDRLRLAAITQFKYATCQLFKSFWQNPAATPIEIAAQFGTNAAQAFIEHAAAVQFILERGVTMSPEEYVPDATKWAYTINPDGTVTITAVPE